jgi:excisionase family DNA binding protein
MASPEIEAMVPDRPVLDVKEVARILGVNAKTVYAEVDSGGIPAIRLRRRIRISRSVVIAILEQGQLPRSPPQVPTRRSSRRRGKR